MSLNLTMSVNKWKKWSYRYCQLADTVAQWSEDRSTKVGAVIADMSENRIISLGYNGFPRGVDQSIDERHERPVKYSFTEHAERNAIFNAEGCRGTCMFLNFLPECCEDCTRAIIQSGITGVVGLDIPFPGKGKGKHYAKGSTSAAMFKEAGVSVFSINESLDLKVLI